MIPRGSGVDSGVGHPLHKGVLMSAFAGIYHYDRERCIEISTCAKIKKLINRSAKNVVTEFHSPGIYIAHVNIGAYVHPTLALHENHNALVVAGQPLVSGPNVDISKEIDELANSLGEDSTMLLKSA